MALLPSEVQRIRHELGYPVVGIDAAPYVSYVSIFDQVIIPYLNAGPKTTSSTYVPPIGADAGPTPATLTLDDATGFLEGHTVWIDVDARQERATIAQLSGSTITLFLRLPHGMPAPDSLRFPITVEGGEAIVRELLADILALRTQMSTAGANAGNVTLLAAGGGLKKADEIEFYQGNWANTLGGAMFVNLNTQLRQKRCELASALGVANLWELKSGGGSFSVSPY